MWMASFCRPTREWCTVPVRRYRLACSPLGSLRSAVAEAAAEAAEAVAEAVAAAAVAAVAAVAVAAAAPAAATPGVADTLGCARSPDQPWPSQSVSSGSPQRPISSSSPLRKPG